MKAVSLPGRMAATGAEDAGWSSRAGLTLTKLVPEARRRRSHSEVEWTPTPPDSTWAPLIGKPPKHHEPGRSLQVVPGGGLAPTQARSRRRAAGGSSPRPTCSCQLVGIRPAAEEAVELSLRMMGATALDQPYEPPRSPRCRGRAVPVQLEATRSIASAQQTWTYWSPPRRSRRPCFRSSQPGRTTGCVPGFGVEGVGDRPEQR